MAVHAVEHLVHDQVEICDVFKQAEQSSDVPILNWPLSNLDYRDWSSCLSNSLLEPARYNQNLARAPPSQS